MTAMAIIIDMLPSDLARTVKVIARSLRAAAVGSKLPNRWHC